MSLITCIIIAMLSIGGCTMQNTTEIPNAKQSTYQNITPQEAKQRLDQDKSIILLDVRTKAEYEEIHIPDSLLIPLDVLKGEAEENLTDKNLPIFIYCRSGRRSIEAANILLDLGYTNVYNLGGIIDWPYETKSVI